VQIGKKRVRVPVLVTLGVCADGRRVVLDMRIAGEESEVSWSEVLQSLVECHVGTPLLAVIDGNPGLYAALLTQWPKLAINHKPWNLLAKAAAHLREELAEDYRRMIYAGDRGDRARRLLAQVEVHCKAVISSLEEGGEARNCSTSCSSINRSARRCTPPMPWKESTRNSVAAPRPRLLCPARAPSYSCSLAS